MLFYKEYKISSKELAKIVRLRDCCGFQRVLALAGLLGKAPLPSANAIIRLMRYCAGDRNIMINGIAVDDDGLLHAMELSGGKIWCASATAVYAKEVASILVTYSADFIGDVTPVHIKITGVTSSNIRSMAQHIFDSFCWDAIACVHHFAGVNAAVLCTRETRIIGSAKEIKSYYDFPEAVAVGQLLATMLPHEGPGDD